MSKQDYTAEEVTRALMAVIAYAGNLTAASRYIDDQFDQDITVQLLSSWVNRVHATEYQRLRDEHGREMEARLAHEFRDVAVRSVSVQALALARAEERLSENKDADPAKTAAFAARTGGTAVEKLMTLTNRPERITENRDITEVLRSLAARKIITVTDSTAEEVREIEK